MTTHFDLFALPPRHALSADALDKKYRELSLGMHPDRQGKADAKERRMALEQTTALNEAYKVLKDPVKRAFYLLKLLGVDLDREDAGAQKDMPLEFLEEVMELREQLEDARSKKDLALATAMARAVEDQRERALASAVKSLQTLEKAPKDDDARRNASHQLGRVRYFNRFLEEVEAIEEEASA